MDTENTENTYILVWMRGGVHYQNDIHTKTVLYDLAVSETLVTRDLYVCSKNRPRVSVWLGLLILESPLFPQNSLRESRYSTLASVEVNISVFWRYRAISKYRRRQIEFGLNKRC